MINFKSISALMKAISAYISFNMKHVIDDMTHTHIETMGKANPDLC